MGEVLGIVGQLSIAVGLHGVAGTGGRGPALVVDVGAVDGLIELTRGGVLAVHDEEVLVAVVGDVGAEGVQALELLHHVVGLLLADERRPVLVPNVMGHMCEGLYFLVALDLAE